MYNTYNGGCNILNLQVSRHKTIDVKSNNTKMWDYTNPLLPVGDNQRMGNSNSDMGMNMMVGGMNQNQNNMNKNNMMPDHPLLPMPMNMAAAAAAAAAAGHQFNSTSPFMQQHSQHHQQMSHSNQGLPGANSNPYTAAAAAAAAAVAAQSVTGYPMQTMDGRSAVVQVSNFADQVYSCCCYLSVNMRHTSELRLIQALLCYYY
jgi:hypothetical protein